MARSLNKVMLIGNLGKDPQMRYTPAGVAVATFSLAMNESWKDKDTGETKERTEWANIVAWRKLAEICSEYLKKGSKVYVEGRLQTRSYEKDGAKRWVTEVVLDNLLMLSGKPTNGAGSGSGETYPDLNAPQSAGPKQDDDLPF